MANIVYNTITVTSKNEANVKAFFDFWENNVLNTDWNDLAKNEIILKSFRKNVQNDILAGYIDVRELFGCNGIEGNIDSYESNWAAPTLLLKRLSKIFDVKIESVSEETQNNEALIYRVSKGRVLEERWGTIFEIYARKDGESSNIKEAAFKYIFWNFDVEQYVSSDVEHVESQLEEFEDILGDDFNKIIDSVKSGDWSWKKELGIFY